MHRRKWQKRSSESAGSQTENSQSFKADPQNDKNYLSLERKTYDILAKIEMKLM